MFPCVPDVSILIHLGASVVRPVNPIEKYVLSHSQYTRKNNHKIPEGFPCLNCPDLMTCNVKGSVCEKVRNWNGEPGRDPMNMDKEGDQ